MYIYQRSISYKWCAIFFCFTGFFIDLIGYYPGFFNSDAIIQYNEALTGKYSDWHPPIMAALWRLLNYIYSGPQLMLVFQLLCFWISCYLLMVIIKNKVWMTMVMLFSIAPFTQNYVAFLNKDSGMALTWLLAAVILFRAMSEDRRLSVIESIVSILLIIYASWVRHNALPGSIPFCVMWSWLVLKNNKRFYKVAFAVVLTFFLFLGKNLFEKKVLKATHSPTFIWTCLMDINAIYATTGINYYPPVLYNCPNFDTAYLRSKYAPGTSLYLWKTADSGKWIICDYGAYNEIHRCWIRAISDNPVAYIKNKLTDIVYILRIKNGTPLFQYLYPWLDENPYGFVFKQSKLSNKMINAIILQHDLPYMRPWFWLFLNILLFFLFPLLKNARYRFFYITLTSSGLLYILPLLVAMNADYEFRYFYWNCIACSLSLFLFIYDRYAFKSNIISDFVAKKFYLIAGGVFLVVGYYFFYSPSSRQLPLRFNDINPAITNANCRTFTYKDFNIEQTIEIDDTTVVPIWSGALVTPSKVLPRGNYKITIVSNGTPLADIYPHLNVFVNDNKIGDYFTTKNFSPISFIYEQKQDGNIKLRLQMDNDAEDKAKHEDRNAFISYISIIKYKL